MNKEIIKEEEVDEEVEDEATEKMLSDILEAKVADLEEKYEAKLEEKLEKALEDERERMKKKSGIYNQEVQEKENRKEKNDTFKGIMKHIVAGDIEGARKFLKTKDHSTTEPSEVVDTELAPEILALQEEYGVARQLFRTMQLSKHKYAANELATDVTVYWVDEGDSITASNITITQNELSLSKLAALVSMTNELLEDSEVDLVSFITQRVAEAFAEAEDTKFLADDTEGLINVADDSILRLSETDMTAIADKTLATELADIQGEVTQSVRNRSKYLMSWEIFNYIRNLQDDNGQFLFKNLKEGGEMMLHGKPIVLSDVLPGIDDVNSADEPVLMFGDFERACILGYKGGLRVDRATQGSINPVGSEVNLFQTDRQAVRFIQRTGYTQVLSNTVAVLKTATS
jgi:HK97 family phage major capsid protein